MLAMPLRLFIVNLQGAHSTVPADGGTLQRARPRPHHAVPGRKAIPGDTGPRLWNYHRSCGVAYRCAVPLLRRALPQPPQPHRHAQTPRVGDPARLILGSGGFSATHSNPARVS